MDTTQDNGDECVDNNSSVAVTQDANVYPVVISRSEIGEVCVKPEYFKCDHRSCKNTQSSCQQLVCAGLHGCTKKLHWNCYKEFVLDKNGVNHFTNSHNVIACTKKHHDLAKKRMLSLI